MSLSKLAARTFETGIGRSANEATVDSNGSAGLSKWQLALLIGTPVVIGGLVYYYCYSDDTADKVDSSKSKATGPPPTTSRLRGGNANHSLKAKSAVSAKATLTLPAEILAKNKGNEFFKHHKYKEATECYTEAINLCPEGKKEDLATFYQNRAASNEMLGVDTQQIINDCSEALKLNPRYVKALIRRAKALEKIGNYEGALTDFTAAIILESFSNQSSLQATDRILKKLSKVRAKEYYKNRVPSLPSNQFIQQYYRSFTRDPLFPAGSKVDADRLVSKLDELVANATPSGEEDSRVSLLLGTLELLKGNLSAAHQYLSNVITNIPSNISTADQEKIDIKVNALIKLATITANKDDENSPTNESSADLESSKRDTQTVEYLSEAISLDPSNADIYAHRAQLLLFSEKIEECRSDLEKAVSLAPSFDSALAQHLYVDFRCAMRYGLSDVEAILRKFDEAAKKFPHSAEILSLYAQALMEIESFDAADEYFLKALQADPLDANVHVHRAILLMRENNNSAPGIQLLQRAAEVDPKCQFAHEMLGTVYIQMGEMKKGIKSFELAISCANTEKDVAHLFALKDAAEAQLKASEMLNISLAPPK